MCSISSSATSPSDMTTTFMSPTSAVRSSGFRSSSSIPFPYPETRRAPRAFVIRSSVRSLFLAGSKGDVGLELHDVHVGRRARIRARLQHVAPRHERREPGPRSSERHIVAVPITRVLNVDALAGEEVRGDDRTPREAGEDVDRKSVV